MHVEATCASMQQNNGPPTPVTQQEDILQYITGLEPPSQAVFQNLQQLRMVSKTTRHFADQQLANNVWRKCFHSQAAEFLHDLAPGALLTVGAPQHAGVHRLLHNNDYHALGVGMQKFLMDRNTQLSILVHLQSWFATNQRRELVSRSEGYQLHRAIARALRQHHEFPRLVQLACEVLTLIGRPSNLSRGFCVYLVETLVMIMHENSTDNLLQYRCLEIIFVNTTLHIPQKVGPYVMLNVILRCISEINNINTISTPPGHHEFNITNCGVRLLSRFLKSLLIFPNNPDVALTYPTHEFAHMESTLLNTMQRFAFHSTHVWPCMGALLHLYENAFTWTYQHLRASELTVNALITHGGNSNTPVVATAIPMLIALMPGLWEQPHGPMHTAHARTHFPGSILIAIGTLVISNTYLLNVDTKALCTKLFQLFFLLCQNHPQHMQCAINHNVLQILDHRYKASVRNADVDAAWLLHRNRFEALLLAPAAAP